jgi:hypothetical protein
LLASASGIGPLFGVGRARSREIWRSPDDPIETRY